MLEFVRKDSMMMSPSAASSTRVARLCGAFELRSAIGTLLTQTSTSAVVAG
jgi:hypothetical protein